MAVAECFLSLVTVVECWLLRTVLYVFSLVKIVAECWLLRGRTVLNRFSLVVSVAECWLLRGRTVLYRVSLVMTGSLNFRRRKHVAMFRRFRETTYVRGTDLNRTWAEQITCQFKAGRLSF
jgi:hypothetical protein